ncbi:MAG: glycosyltransferase family 4 protein [Elusimicrobia bacterium]|nr:glycosyltransferase family 4 protein [Elusimicrobiota bacterium]
MLTRPGAPLSIVVVTANFHPYIGGSEKQALAVARELVRRGHRVVVATRSVAGAPRAETLDGVEVRRLCACGPGPLGTLAFLASLICFLLARRYDALHVNLLSSHAVPAALAGWLAGKRVAIKLGGGVGVGEIALSSASALGRLKLAVVGRLGPTLVAVNPAQLEELRKSGFGDVECRLIPNGVDTSAYAPPGREARERLRASLGWTGTVFLFVGRLASDKGQVDVLRSFLEGWAQARRDGFAGTLYLAGAGPAQAEFERLAAQPELGGSVRLLGARQDAASLYQAADIFVLPTISEGLSNALLEAMASGLPVLASRVTGTRDVIEEGKQGLLFEPFDADEARRQLEALVRDPALPRRLGAAARERAVASFSLSKTVDRWLAVYEGAPPS